MSYRRPGPIDYDGDGTPPDDYYGDGDIDVKPYGSIEQYSPVDLVLPDIKLKIARLSPSFVLIAKLLEGGISLDGLTWREFEELVAYLLEKDGYRVELGPGRNDGGVDIIA